jgi:DNA-binding response OmpR family regulator
MMAAENDLFILIAEDDEDTGDSLKLALEASGYEVHLTRDGEDAMRAAVALRPDVVLMDIQLPGIDGHDAAERIRAQRPGAEILIVALTGLDRPAVRARSREAGIDHHLVKPVDIATLVGLFRDFAAQRRATGRTA